MKLSSEPSSRSRCRSCSTTLRGITRHGTKGRCAVGAVTQSAAISASMTFAAASKCSTRPAWCQDRTVSSPHWDRVSIPPSPSCTSRSRSAQPSCWATTRRAVRSSCFLPGKIVLLSDRSTGTQFCGSRVSQTIPRAQGCISCCCTITVPGLSGRAPLRSCTMARPARSSQSFTRSYTPGMNSMPIVIGPCGRGEPALSARGGAALAASLTSARGFSMSCTPCFGRLAACHRDGRPVLGTHIGLIIST